MSDNPPSYESKLRRPMHVGCRLSEKEYALVSAAATDANLAPADWFRRTILDSLAPKDEPTTTLLLEVIEALERYQDRYTQGTQSCFMLEFSGEVAAT